jgi:uncharacterized protein TIGR03905
MYKKYIPSGVCAREIKIEVDDDNVIQSIEFIGGCSGNTQGVAALAKGMTIAEFISRCRGLKCGVKGTSCPDQLAVALESIQAEI